jgi:hypothetical protein
MAYFNQYSSRSIRESQLNCWSYWVQNRTDTNRHCAAHLRASRAEPPALQPYKNKNPIYVYIFLPLKETNLFLFSRNFQSTDCISNSGNCSHPSAEHPPPQQLELLWWRVGQSLTLCSLRQERSWQASSGRLIPWGRSTDNLQAVTVSIRYAK